MRRTILVVCVALLFLPWISIARAEEAYRLQTIDVDIRHDMSGGPLTSSANMLGDFTRETETWPVEVAGADGVYWGNLIPASTITLPGAGVAVLRTVLNIPQTDISSGASAFWIRIPFDGRNIQYMRLKIDGEVYENITDQPFDFSVDTSSSWTPISKWPLYINDDDFPTGRFGGDKEKTLWNERGIFVRMDHLLSTTYKFELSAAGDRFGGASLYDGDATNFVLDVVVQAAPGTQIRMLISEEQYTTSNEMFLVNDDDFTIRNIYLFDPSEFPEGVVPRTVVGTPAWAFVFMEGVGSNNMWSFHLAPDRNDEYANLIEFNLIVDTPDSYDWNGNYTTIQVPYIGATEWEIVVIVKGGGRFSSGNTRWYYNSTLLDGLLTVSPPFYFENIGASGLELSITLVPFRGIRFICGFDVFAKYNFVDRSVDEFADSYLKTWLTTRSSSVYGGVDIPIFANVWMTSGVYAEVTWVGGQMVADFKWGRGHIYPGRMELLIELSPETRVYWEGNVEVIYGGYLTKDVGDMTYKEKEALVQLFRDDPPPTEGEDVDLWHLVINTVLNSGALLWDSIKGAISTLWSYIARTLEWIGNWVIDLVGKVIAFLKNVVQFLGNILKGLIWCLPPALIVISLAFCADPSHVKSAPRRAIVAFRSGESRVKSRFPGEQRAKDMSESEEEMLEEQEKEDEVAG